jgi:hypothetical protein
MSRRGDNVQMVFRQRDLRSLRNRSTGLLIAEMNVRFTFFTTLKDGNVKTLMEFAIVAGDEIEKSPKRSARFDAVVQDLDNRV